MKLTVVCLLLLAAITDIRASSADPTVPPILRAAVRAASPTADDAVSWTRGCTLAGADGTTLLYRRGLCAPDFSADDLNLMPIVGILAQEPGKSMRRALKKHGLTNVSSYIAASYVKSFESSGLRVVPIMINQNADYYKKMASALNGIVFPGGAASITGSSGYGRAGALLYKHVKEANARGMTLPLWSTCLGFEMMLYLATNESSEGRIKPLTSCLASNRRDPLFFSPGWDESRLFIDMPPRLVHALNTEDISSNFHKYCVLPRTMAELGLDASFAVLSTSYDDVGVEYVSTVEHRRWPIWGTQWHPEKPAYEWRDGLTGIPHTREAIAANNHLMTVFADHARKNHQSFESDEEAARHLIYNHETFDVQKLYRSSFLQVYFF